MVKLIEKSMHTRRHFLGGSIKNVLTMYDEHSKRHVPVERIRNGLKWHWAIHRHHSHAHHAHHDTKGGAVIQSNPSARSTNITQGKVDLQKEISKALSRTHIR